MYIQHMVSFTIPTCGCATTLFGPHKLMNTSNDYIKNILSNGKLVQQTVRLRWVLVPIAKIMFNQRYMIKPTPAVPSKL
jgi:hypothetical protein